MVLISDISKKLLTIIYTCLSYFLCVFFPKMIKIIKILDKHPAGWYKLHHYGI
jgi:hypothetical protein